MGVLLHGYAKTSHMGKPLMSQLETSHTVLAADLCGAGGSERTQEGVDMILHSFLDLRRP